ncbi:mechanosensitive ion channel family protein [Desulfobacula sp.]|uniref:mechanosensitive ion channel family protein n=1 Tax=Desulfobacula sp. TaxID=2593537 RepID=UPI0025C5ABCF|nr:mechanosensitive ion channel [Desulfobacula sp.]
MKDEITAIQKMIDTLIEFSVSYGFQVVGAIVILILGAVAASWTAKIILGLMQRKNIDITLSKFLSNIVKILIITFTVIIALGKFGITIAPFIAAIGALAFGATLALQGTLSKNSNVNNENDPIIGIKNFGDSSVDIGFRYWVPTVKYYNTSYAVNLAVFNTLKENGIDIPFPQRDVRIVSKA